MSPVTSAVQPPEVAHLAALIRAQADTEVRQIAHDAEQRTQRLRAEARAEAASIDAAARRAGEARGRRQAAALLAEAETYGHREWLWARERLLEAVLARVEAQLAGLSTEPATIEPLVRLVEEAIAVLPNEPLRVRVARGYEALVGLLLESRLAGSEHAYRVEADSIVGGGVIVETDTGRLRFDNSFAARLRRLNGELRGAAAAVLFAE